MYLKSWEFIYWLKYYVIDKIIVGNLYINE
jgi:hypothetical protein